MRTNRWLFVPLVAALSAGLILGACGGDDDDNGENVDTPVPAGPDQRLNDLQAAFVEIEFTGTYTIETTSENSSVVGQATYVSLPPDNLSVDFSGDFGGISGRLVLINTVDATYICQEASGDDAPPAFCLEGNAGVIGVGDIAQLQLANVVSGIGPGGDVTVEEADGREIAGRDGECFAIIGTETDGTICFDEETGVMLLTELTHPGGSIHIEATEIDDGTDEDAFEPPFDILDIG